LTRIAIAVTDPDWQARTLLQAFRELGAEARAVRLAECVFDTTVRTGLRIAGFDGLPDAVLVRTIGAGTFEEVTRRLGILHALGGLGVVVWNRAAAIERCVDKSMTSFLLAQAGVATPASFAVEGREAAEAVVRREQGLVLKPLFGSQGRGLRLVRAPEQLPEPQAMAGVYYLQRFVPTVEMGGFRDFRLLVCGGEVVAAMARRGSDWITNVRRGGVPEPLLPDDDLVSAALGAVQAVGADYAGVDLIRGPGGGVMVIEVNSMPGWKGLQSVTNGPIARHVAAAVLRAL
jgi:tetrahydromethanopterin:alpha-L-glutamate ligase